MAKILLVEDDNNLREIYGERLIAEGYDIVSAGDGEEALQTAVQEKPDLIISDVMMPKISGFDMLDILRQTPETKNVKIIMMTALSQAEDKSRADTLGADKYLVKSQVTLEDVARVVHDLLGDGGEEEAATVISEATDSTAEVANPQPEVQATTSESMTVSVEPSVNVAQEPMPQANFVTEPVASEQTVAAPQPATPVAEGSSPITAQLVVDDPSPAFTNPIAQQAAEPVATASAVDQTSSQVQSPIPQPINASTPAVTQTVNPITGMPVVATEPQQASDPVVQAQDTQSELNELNQQIEQFAQEPVTFEPLVQAPMQEPTEQQLIHAQNAAEEPQVVSAQPVQSQMVNPPMPNVSVDAANPEPASNRKKVIEPVSDLSAGPDIHALYEQEMAKEAENSPVMNPNSGAVINGEYLQQSANPIADAMQTPQEASAQVAPLETIDPTQIAGVQLASEPSVTETPQPAETPASSENNNPTSAPNNIAL